MRDEFLDSTLEFGGSVGSAEAYFTGNPEDQRKVKVYSKRVKKWFANTNPKTGKYTHTIFYKHPEFNSELTDEIFDLTAEFEESVRNAIAFFTDHPNYKRIAKIKSSRRNKWYANTNPKTGEYTHEKFYEYSEFNKKYLINDIYKNKYYKYKKKYLQLKKGLKNSLK